MMGTLDEMIQEMKQGVHDYTKDGKCSNCGQCCADNLPVSKAEIRRIRKYIQKHGIKEQKHLIPVRNPNMVDLTCPFRNNGTQRCVIYEVRPLICREFQCDKPARGEWAGPEMYKASRDFISMRDEFFKKS